MTHTQRDRMYSALGVPKGSERLAAGVGARRLGITVREWVENRRDGRKWCFRCKSWKSVRDFDLCRTVRRDGRKGQCRLCCKVFEV